MSANKYTNFDICPTCGRVKYGLDPELNMWNYVRMVETPEGERYWQGSMDMKIWIKV